MTGLGCTCICKQRNSGRRSDLDISWLNLSAERAGVHVAASLAAAFHAAHEASVIIGDVNHGSVRAGKDGRVRLSLLHGARG